MRTGVSAEKGAAQFQCDGAVETREELLTTFSFAGRPDTTHVQMNEAAPPRGQAAERRVFFAYPKTQRSAVLLALPISQKATRKWCW